MTVHVGGIVLAAGAGTRFGMPKVLAGEGRWLRNAVAALDDGGCDDIVVVLGAAVVDVPAPARPVTATDWAEGMSASLRAGISALSAGSADYAVVLTVDTPDIGADPVRRVLDAARASGSGIARACYGERPGHPVVIGRRHWAQLLATLHGDEGARAFLRSRSDVVAVDCADLATGADIDVNRATVMPSACPAKPRTARSATSMASVLSPTDDSVAVAGSSVTSATTSPVIGSQTSHR